VLTHTKPFLSVAGGARSAPAEFRSDVLEDAFEHVGVVVHTQLVRDREEQRIGRLDNYRVWLALSAGSILAVWIFTVVAFWPRNGTLFAAGSGLPIALTDRAELIRQARLWVRYDWCRIAMMVVGFISAVRTISIPTPTSPGPPGGVN